MKRQQQSDKAKPRVAGPLIPDKARDCGPQVDTWPILDTDARDEPRKKDRDEGKRSS